MCLKKRKKSRKATTLRYPNNLQQLASYKEELEVRELQLIEKGLTSNSPHDIVKAQKYIRSIEAKKQNKLKAFSFVPDNDFYNGLGYKRRPTTLTYDIIRQMAKTPQIAAIIQTRIDQAMNYGEFTTDLQKPGWTIVKNVSRFADDKERELSDEDKRNINGLVDWLERGGNDVNEWEGDDWDGFLKKLFRDSWEIDQACFEISWLRRGIPHQYQAVDGGTIRLSDNFDDQYYQEQREQMKGKELMGFLPKYVQIYKSQVRQEFYPWELCMGMRNQVSNVYNNGYATSELEILIQIVTWMLYGMQYNGNFFQQGSNPKGILNFKNNIDASKVEEFKQAWRNTVSGVDNSHKMAVTSGSDLEWISMMSTNKDMEFHTWNEFLTILACTVFRIDISEVGFHIKEAGRIFGQDGQKMRLQHSKQKGLEPFLRYWQGQFDKYLINPLTRGRYKFIYTGIDIVDEEKALDRDIKVLQNGGMTVQDFFMKYSNKELDPVKDILLNQAYLQHKETQMMGGAESNAAVGALAEENPFDKFEENVQKGTDPFDKLLNNYIKTL